MPESIWDYFRTHLHGTAWNSDKLRLALKFSAGKTGNWKLALEDVSPNDATSGTMLQLAVSIDRSNSGRWHLGFLKH
jgi:hypothetical protein